MRAWRTLAAAMAKGFVRDRTALFFTILFPLLFLILFGGVFGSYDQSKSSLVEIGRVPLLSELRGGAKTAFDDSFSVSHSTDWSGSIQRVRKGKVDAAVEQKGDRLVLHFSQADQTKAAVVRGTLSSFVDAANLGVSGQPPRYTLDAQQVEDSSLKGIQFVTPGILGWAIATSAAFGASLTLVTYRQNELLRRLRLAPLRTGALVSARIAVTIGVALVQFAIFVGLAVVLFGLKLTGSWWVALPLVLFGTLTFMAIGLLTGSLTSSSEAASAATNLIVLPMAFLSGSFIPLDVAPGWLRVVSHIFPLRYLNEGMLDVMVRGRGPSAALVPIAVLLAFTVVITAIATRFFRWDATV
ncbi:MAG: ABC transporter permease [Acidimicrobiales bacterium]